MDEGQKNPPALSGLLSNERVLVLGASGWFGATLRAALGKREDVMLIASQTRRPCIPFDRQRIADFAPTMVFGFAFLTREKLQSMPLDEYMSTNRRLIENFVTSVELSSVRCAITISSGAAISEPESPYGRLKLEEEYAARTCVDPGRKTVTIGRAYSLSGPWVKRPRDYAFSDLILQAQEGIMRISAKRPTYRRYVSVDDFLHVMTSLAQAGESITVESGGELVEMSELADNIRRVVNPNAQVLRPEFGGSASHYCSTDGSWEEASKATGWRSRDLESQIRVTASGLASPVEM